MPYIPPERRKDIVFESDMNVKCISISAVDAPGEMNYAITEMMIDYLNRKGISYTNMNEVIGVLECAKLEMYRRATAPYEDEKIKSNGDVYYYDNKNKGELPQ